MKRFSLLSFALAMIAGLSAVAANGQAAAPAYSQTAAASTASADSRSAAGSAASAHSQAAAAPAALTYDQLHPYYAEFCAVTQLTPLNGEKGGIGGHGVLYLKGTCLEPSRGYPRLKICDEGSVDLSNKDSGVSISVDKMFRNVNWVGSKGKTLLTTGGVRQDQALDQSAQDTVVRRVVKDGLFNGIDLHDVYKTKKPDSLSTAEYAAGQGVSTDFATNFGRNVYCTRLPIKKEMLVPMIKYLNFRNDEYRQTKDYKWSGIWDNCTHTTHNALAAAGVWRKLGTNEFLPKQIFNLAIPGNEFINMTRLGNDSSLNNVVAFYHNKYKLKMLMEHDWMATQPGVLTENFAAHATKNSLYETKKSKFLILDLPLLRAQHREFKIILRDQRYSNVTANLLAFREKYRAALEAKRPIEQLNQEDSEEFRQFYAKYYDHIERALENVEAQLGQNQNPN
jgi:hypothetical protein